MTNPRTAGGPPRPQRTLPLVIRRAAALLLQSQRWLWSGEGRQCACCGRPASTVEHIPLCDRHRRVDPLRD